MGLPTKLIFAGHKILTFPCLYIKEILTNIKLIISAMVNFQCLFPIE